MDAKCFLDLDGVLVDFVAGLGKFAGVELDPFPYPGCWDFVDKLGVENLWDQLDADFWANLDWTKDGRTLLEMVEEIFGCNDVYICTSATNNPTSYVGKYRWMEQHMPNYLSADHLIFARSKHALASPQSILIDDRDKSIDKFNLAGGHGVLVPAPWNREHGVMEQSLGIVNQRVRMTKYCIDERGRFVL